MGGDSGKPGAWEAASLVFRIATTGLSLASAIMTAASTQCVHGGATVSYSDYNSFKYSALADLLSAVLQGVAIYLEVVKKEKAAKAVELIDKLLLALTSTSATLLFAVDDITSCGVGDRRRSSRVCTQASRFCGQIRASSAVSLAAATSVCVAVFTRKISRSVARTPEAEELPTDDESESPTDLPTTRTNGTDCTQIPTETPPVRPRPCCRCPRTTILDGCENPDEPEPCVHGSVPTLITTQQPHGIYSYEPQGVLHVTVY